MPGSIAGLQAANSCSFSVFEVERQIAVERSKPDGQCLEPILLARPHCRYRSPYSRATWRLFAADGPLVDDRSATSCKCVRWAAKVWRLLLRPSNLELPDQPVLGARSARALRCVHCRKSTTSCSSMMKRVKVHCALQNARAERFCGRRRSSVFRLSLNSPSSSPQPSTSRKTRTRRKISACFLRQAHRSAARVPRPPLLEKMVSSRSRNSPAATMKSIPSCGRQWR